MSGRCEPAVAEAAGYAARLAARHHSADDVTDRISELLQSYLLAQYLLVDATSKDVALRGNVLTGHARHGIR